MFQITFWTLTNQGTLFQSRLTTQGSGCGWAVASNSRGPRFESSNWQKIILNIVCYQLFWKEKSKRGREWPIFKKLPNSKYVRDICSIPVANLINILCS